MASVLSVQSLSSFLGDLETMVSPTPLETYWIQGERIHVKRDDLFASPPAPPNAKARGLADFVRKLREAGVRRVGVFQASVSQVGLLLAAVCREVGGIEAIVIYPKRGARALSQSAVAAEGLGATIIPIASNVVHVCYAQARRLVEERQGYMLPFGLNLPGLVESIAAEARTVPPQMFEEGTIVVCCGSGVTAAGILKGIRSAPAEFHGVSCGRSVDKIQKVIHEHVERKDLRIVFVPPEIKFSCALDYPVPFSCDPFYDRKAWKYTIECHAELPKPILFWNVGGEIRGDKGGAPAHT